MTQASSSPSGSSLPAATAEPQWYAVRTRSRHEKVVADQLSQRAVEHVLPLYRASHRWKDRVASVELPLFDGYVFVRIPYAERRQVLTVRGVADFVGFAGQPCSIPSEQMEPLFKLCREGIAVQPHPFLREGQQVRIRRGPFADVEGILIRQNTQRRLVLSVDLIQRSVSIEVDAADVVPAPQDGSTPSAC